MNKMADEGNQENNDSPKAQSFSAGHQIPSAIFNVLF